ncbi:hypothetical protein ABZ078_21615 [Streptomyces sp. NPDC006385]|uniref:hypothetical protein n=1 Tax=Streptomyces sp. NPDC006385 TaxID=3156761 RepID=UPI0033A3FCBB
MDDAEEDRLVRFFTLILVAVSAGYTALALAATLLTATAGRVRDFRVLRLSGATPALFGTVHGLRERLGMPVELSVAWPWVIGAVAGCLIFATTATVLPARTALRRMRRV